MLEKIKELIIDENNRLLVRLLMVIFGVVVGTIFVLLSSLFNDKSVSVTLLVFGCVIFGAFLFAPGIWYISEQ